MNDYKAVYKNTGLTPRSLNDAYKNADYATPIYRQKSREWEDFKNFFSELFIVFGLSFVLITIGYSFYKVLFTS